MSNNDHDKYANYLIFSYYTGSPISAPHTQHVYRVSSAGCPSTRRSVHLSPPVCLSCPSGCSVSEGTFSTK